MCVQMFYILSNFLCGLLEGFEVIVDHWPEWTCVILRPQSVDAVSTRIATGGWAVVWVSGVGTKYRTRDNFIRARVIMPQARYATCPVCLRPAMPHARREGVRIIMPQARYATGPLCLRPAMPHARREGVRVIMPQARYATGPLCHGSAECVNARLLVPKPRLEDY